MLDSQDLEELKSLIKKAVKEEISNALSKRDASSTFKPAPTLESLAKIQIKRCELVSWQLKLESMLYSKDPNKDSPKTDQDIEHDLEEAKAELENLPTTVADKELQEIVDSFDFYHCVDVAAREGWKYRNSAIKALDLIEDTLECAEKLANVKSGRMQIGRIVLYKLYDFELEESYYSLTFCVECGELC